MRAPFMPAPSRHAAAWNAAGQCVAAAEFGLKPSCVAVRQVLNGTGWGVSITGQKIGQPSYRTKAGEAMLLAGAVAEKCAGGDVDLPDDDLRACMSELIERRLPRVHAIAKTLAESASSLEGAELAAILQME